MNLPPTISTAGLSKNTDTGGFTLIELLVVMAIMIALASMLAPTLSSLTNGSRLTQAGQMIGDQIALARQEATSKNRDVEVRLICLGTGSNKAWRGIQVWRLEPSSTGTTTSTPVARIMTLPTGVFISSAASLSPLLSATLTSGTVNVPGSSAAPYAGFRIRPNGSIETSVNWTNNFVTLRTENTSDSKLTNYYTIQINPITGKGIVYRP